MKTALNADVVGYSRLMADDFEATKRVMDDYERLVSSHVTDNQGLLVNFVGDNFMALFDDPAAAMKAAISISAEIESRNSGLASIRQVRFRMGLDLGPASQSGNQWFGDALNIAARIQAIAPEGGVSVSGEVYRGLDEPELRFTSRGRKQLKNIPEQIEVFEYSGLPSAAAGGQAAAGISLADPTIALLPIHTELVDEDLAPLAQIIRDELLHRMSGIHSLNVVDADGSTEASEDPSHYTLETGIAQLGDSVRIYSRLIDLSTFNIVASHRWSSDRSGLLDLADEVAETVARTIEIELVVGEPARLYAELGNPEAIQKIYTGWYHLTAGTAEGWAKAVELFDEVAQDHPDQAFGPTLGSFAKWAAAAEGMVPDREATLSEALELAEIGLERNDPTGLAQMVKAAVFMSRGQAEEARDLLDEVEITRPTCDTTFAIEGSVRRYLGEWDKSVDAMNKAIRLTAVTKPWYPTVQACSLFLGGNLEQASETAAAVVEYQPNNLEALLILSAAQMELGLERRAKATADLIRERFPTVDVDEWIERNPYQTRESVERWKDDLRAAGALN